MTTLEEVLDPAYVADLADMTLDEVRAKRDQAQRVENGVSYLRRLAQGHLDIVEHERRRRDDGGGQGAPGEGTELSELIGRLPDILAEHGRAPGAARPPQDLDPTEVPPELEARLEAIVAGADLGDLPRLDVATVEQLAEQLTDFERLVSTRRHELHACIDTLHDEIKRRYRDGQASVDSLLT